MRVGGGEGGWRMCVGVCMNIHIRVCEECCYLDVVAMVKGVDSGEQVVHDDEAQVGRADDAFVAIHAQKMGEECAFVGDDVVVVAAGG